MPVRSVAVATAFVAVASIGCGDESSGMETSDGPSGDGATVDSFAGGIDTRPSTDPEAGVCATASPPIVPDYLQDCRLAFSKPVGPGGVVTAAACASGICLVSDDLKCVREGCTLFCHGDHECPSGSTCHADFFYDPTDETRGVCAPGPRTSAPTGIVCHDPPTDAGDAADAADSG
jgi:hypothetical protein